MGSPLPMNLHDSATQAPYASFPDQPPLNSQPHGLPNHSSPPDPTFPLYRVFLSSDDFYARTVLLDKNTGTTSSIATGWLNDRKSELSRRQHIAQQNGALARATRKRWLAEEHLAKMQEQEMRVVQTALLNLESGSASDPIDQALGSFSVVQAVHETLLAKQQLAQAELNEAEFRMQVIHDNMEDVHNQIAQSTQQLGDLLREMNLQGIHSTMNPLDDNVDADSVSDGIVDDTYEAGPCSETQDLVASRSVLSNSSGGVVRSDSSDGMTQYFDALEGDELELEGD